MERSLPPKADFRSEIRKSLVQKSYVQMNKNGKTEKLIDTDVRKIFSGESTVLQENSPVPNPGRSVYSAILSEQKCF